MLEYFEKPCEDMWNEECDLVEVIESEKSEWELRLNGPLSLMGSKYISAQFGQRAREIQKYAYSMSWEQEQREFMGYNPNNTPSWEFYLMMQIGLFNNGSFRQKFHWEAREVPEVNMLPHWLRLQNVYMELPGEHIPLYMYSAVLFGQVRG